MNESSEGKPPEVTPAKPSTDAMREQADRFRFADWRNCASGAHMWHAHIDIADISHKLSDWHELHLAAGEAARLMLTEHTRYPNLPTNRPLADARVTEAAMFDKHQSDKLMPMGLIDWALSVWALWAGTGDADDATVVAGDNDALSEWCDDCLSASTHHTTRVQADNNLMGFEHVMGHLNISLRYNVRSQRGEIDYGKGGGWKTMEDSDASRIMSLVRSAAFTSTGRGWETASPSSQMLAAYTETVAKRHSVDPFAEWLEQLPDWDGTHRLPLEAMGLMPSAEMTESMWQWVNLAPMRAAAMRTFEPGEHQIRQLVVLAGDQSIGKSTSWRLSIPPHLTRRAFTDRMCDVAAPYAKDKDAAEIIEGKVFGEFCEIDALKRRESQTVKRFLTLEQLEARRAYGRYNSQIDIMAGWWGTTNDRQPLVSHSSTETRFVLCRVHRDTPADWDVMNAWWDANREQVWAEVVATYLQAHLPSELSGEVNRLAQRGQWHTAERELADEWVQSFTPQLPIYTMSQMAVAAGFISGISDVARLTNGQAQALRDAVYEAGWTDGHTDNRTTGYCPPSVTEVPIDEWQEADKATCETARLDGTL